MIKLSDYIKSNNLYFKDIFDGAGKPWDVVSEIENYIKQAWPKLIKEAGFKEYKKDIYVGKNANLSSLAEIRGPALIGKNSKVGASSLIRGGVIIGENCNIGHGSEVKNAIIGNGTNIAHLNYVGDSIIGSDVNLAAGTILANYKNGAADLEVKVEISGKKTRTGLEKFGALVGDNVKIGCNAVTDPGTIIGKNTLVYPLALIRGTIPAEKIVKYKPQLKIVDKK
jgi:NDP-sugar pyrophosphorylase family protein